jgi:ribosomal protein S18 acetylase RimI-like enzyme
MEPEHVSVIVRVRPDNIGVLSTIADDVFDDGLTDEFLTGFLAGNGHLLAVAHRDGVVIGQVQATVQRHLDGPPQLYIDNLGVSPEHQRQQVATMLLHEIVRWGREHQCAQAWIVTEPDNDAANALYRSIGANSSTTILYSFPIPDNALAQIGTAARPFRK